MQGNGQQEPVDRTGRYSNRRDQIRRLRLLDLLIHCQRELAATAAVVYNAVPIVIAGILGVRPPSDDLAGQVAAIIAYPVMFGSFGVTFLILGVSLIVLALALHDRLAERARFAVRVGTAAGVIGGALLLLQGFMSITVAGPLGMIHAQDPEAAAAAYAANILVNARVTATGFAMFGAFVVIASVLGSRARLLPRMLSYIGILLGIALSGAQWLSGPLFLVGPMLTLVWSTWLGIVLLRSRRGVAPSQIATGPTRA